MFKGIKQRLQKAGRKFRDASQIGVTGVFILSQMLIPFLAVQPVRADHTPDNPGDTNSISYWCTDHGYDGGVKFDDTTVLQAGENEIDPITILITLDDEDEFDDVTSVSGDGVTPTKVIVNGANQDNEYDLPDDQPPYTTPTGQEISHVIVCYDEEDEPETTVKVIKKLVPTNDNGLFDLRIDNQVEADDVGHDGATDKVIVDPSEDVDVDEKAAGGTSLSDYTTSIECRNEGGLGNIVDSASPDGTTSRGLIIEHDKIEPGDDIVCVITNTSVEQVDYCDPRQKPGGMDIAEWLAANQVDGSDCFEINPIPECRSFDVVFTKNLTPYEYSFRYVLGDTTPTVENWEGDGTLPVEFDEDEGSGSVEITYYIVGPEKDYFTGFGMPNIWDGNGTTVEVDTDCEDPVDFCDPAQKPGGMDIAEWLEANEVNGADCFDYEIVQRCGYLDITLNEYPGQKNGWVYEAVYTTDGSIVLPENAEVFPAIFDEEENGGSVDVTWYIVGPEGDYLEGFDLPNFWDGVGETITVDTDCEPDVKVIKYHDLNQNGEFDEGEPKLPDWKFFLDECELEIPIRSLESQGLYGDCLLLLTLNGEQTSYTAQNLLDYCYGGHDHCEKTDENGEAEFKNLEPFTLYRLSEKLKNGWIQTDIDCDYINGGIQEAEGIPVSYNSHLIFVTPNSEITCEVGNYRQAELEITKSNDATDALLPGQSVEFTITVTNPETSATLTDVHVYDLMPEGLSYVEDSAQIDGSDVTLNEPYGTSDPAEWDLGTMEPGDVLELTYTAVVDEDTAPGTYTNVAWTDACEQLFGRLPRLETIVNGDYEYDYRCEEGQREVLGNCPTSQPDVIFYSVDEKDENHEDEADCDPFVESSVTVATVLGESETFVLAVTGAPAILMPVAGLTIAAIALATVLPNRKWRRLFGKFGSFSRSATMSFMALVLSVGLAGSVSAASNAWRLTVADLADQTSQSSLELPYSIASTNSSNGFEVVVDVDGPGSNDFDDIHTFVGSQTADFDLPLPVDGSYDITVTATADFGFATSDTVMEQTVVRDTDAPAEVVYEGVQRDGNTYTLNFNVSGADKVQIFASTSQSFATSQDNLVGEVDGSASSFVYTAPDSDQRYFALVAVDNAGNRSPVVGDTGSAVTDGVAVDTGVVSDAAATDDQTADDEEGQEQAATDEDGDGETDEDDNSGLIVTIIVLAGLAALLYTYFVRKPNEASN